MASIGKHSKLGDKWIFIVPKEYHRTIQKFKNSLKVLDQDIVEGVHVWIAERSITLSAYAEIF